MLFVITGSIFGACLLAMAWFGVAIIPKKENLWKTLPREKIIGTIIGGAALGWSAHIARPLLEGGMAHLQIYVYPLALILTVVSFFFLEYIFTRALGGMLLLSVNFLMHQAYADHAPVRFIFSIICYLVGIAAMFMIGSPWRFRDVLKKLKDEEALRKKITGGIAACGAISLGIALGTLV